MLGCASFWFVCHCCFSVLHISASVNSAVCWCILIVFLLPSFKNEKHQLFRCHALHLSPHPALPSKFTILSRSLPFFPMSLGHNFSIHLTPIAASSPIISCISFSMLKTPRFMFSIYLICHTILQSLSFEFIRQITSMLFLD